MILGRFHLAATFAAVLAACFNPKLPDQVPCNGRGSCPPLQRCEVSAGICVPDDQPAIAALRFLVVPASAEARMPAPAVEVELLDASGARIPLTGGAFALEVAPNPRRVLLDAPVTGTAAAGLVTFTGLRFDKPGVDVRLVARAGSITGTSAALEVTPTHPSVALTSLNEYLSSCATIPYKLTQAQSLPVDVLVEYDPDGPSGPEPFRRATQAASNPGMAGVQGVPGSPGGAGRVFTWNTSADLPGRDTVGQLRITPNVGGVTGDPAFRDVTVENGIGFSGAHIPGQLVLGAFDSNHDGRLEMTLVYSDGLIPLVNATIAFPPNVPVLDVVTGDFDGNGLDDFALALQTETSLALQKRGTWIGDFADAQRVPGVPIFRDLVVADFDNDGMDELAGVEAVTDAVVILHGNRAAPGQLVESGRPWTQQGVGHLHVADLDRDGWPDLIIGRSFPGDPVVIVRGTSAGFSAPSLDSGLTGDVLAVGDVDHDGRDDLLAAEDDGLHVASAAGGVRVPGISASVLGLGDIDGDGRTDLVTVTGHTVELRLHASERGMIAFQPPLTVGTVESAASLLLTDRDLDGRTDIHVLSGVESVGYYAFTNTTPRPCGARLSGPVGTVYGVMNSLALADLNADGKADLVSTSWVSSDERALNVAYGLGDGTFASVPVQLSDYSADDAVLDVEPGDYDGDGATDLAFATIPTDAITFLYSDRAATGGVARVDLHTDVLPYLVASGDLDGDHAPDLVVSGSGKLQIWRGDPAGSRSWADPVVLPTPIEVNEAVCGSRWTEQHCTLRLDDVDRDGHIDILISTPTRLLTFLADPGAAEGFAEPMTTEYADGQLLTTADLLPDGRRTLVMLFGGRQVAAYALAVSGTSMEKVWTGPVNPTGHGSGAAAGALDGSGRDEVILGFSGLQLISGTPELSVETLSPTGASRLAVTDLDGDGTAEIIADHSTIYVSPGGQLELGEIISPRGTARADGSAERMALGDIDGDGLLDLAVADSSENKVWLARQAPEHPGTLETEARAWPAAPYVALGDLDGDHRADLVTPGSGGALAFLDVGGTPAEPRCTTDSSLGPIAIGDVTGDGRADIVTSSESAILLFEAVAFSCPAPRIVMSLERPGATKHGAKAIALGDMNIDGMLDVVVISDAVRVALQVPDAPGTFRVTDFEYEDVPGYPTYFDGLVADVNQDGQADVVAIGKHEEIRVFINNPFFPGALYPSTVVPGSDSSAGNLGPQSTSLALADIDGDGWRDVVTMGASPYGTNVFLDSGFGRYGYAYSLVARDTSAEGGRLSVVDFDADGHGDVVYVSPSSGTILLRGR